MRKLAIFQFLLVLPLYFSHAQNWAPLNRTEKFNYRLTGANIVSAQIKVDSAKLVNGDSVYYLNRIAKYCDTCTQTYGVASNLPQFLQRQVTLKGSGVYNFTDTLNLALYTLAPLGYSWLYDSTNNISAQVLEIDTTRIFNTLDSVKVIGLSSGDTIKISKSFGIIKYPYKYGVTNGVVDTCYTLTGIAGRNVGELLPGFKGAFNWNVGDMFEIDAYEWNGAEGDVFERTTYKFTVNSKYVSGDTIKYIVHLLQNTVNIGFPYSYNGPVDTLVFIDSANHIANNYPNQLCSLPDSFNPWFADQFYGYFNNAGGYYTTVNPSVTLISSGTTGETSSESSNSIFNGTTTAQYSEGLGLTSYNMEYFEYSSTWNLVTYRKGNDTVGTFTPDSDFYTAAVTPQAQQLALVYPNPATDHITIALKNAQQGTITISNLQGQPVKKDDINSNTTTIDISSLASGMYLLGITTEAGTEYVKVVKQ